MADNNLTTAPEQTELSVSAAERPSTGGSEELTKANSSSGVKRPGDRVFEFLSSASATLITVMIAAIAGFLLWRAVPALGVNDGGIMGFFTYGGRW